MLVLNLQGEATGIEDIYCHDFRYIADFRHIADFRYIAKTSALWSSGILIWPWELQLPISLTFKKESICGFLQEL
ncbi:hypothetical protein STEG23_027976 [Scotinomys teguina]